MINSSLYCYLLCSALLELSQLRQCEVSKSLTPTPHFRKKNRQNARFHRQTAWDSAVRAKEIAIGSVHFGTPHPGLPERPEKRHKKGVLKRFSTPLFFKDL